MCVDIVLFACIGKLKLCKIDGLGSGCECWSELEMAALESERRYAYSCGPPASRVGEVKGIDAYDVIRRGYSKGAHQG